MNFLCVANDERLQFNRVIKAAFTVEKEKNQTKALHCLAMAQVFRPTNTIPLFSFIVWFRRQLAAPSGRRRESWRRGRAGL